MSKIEDSVCSDIQTRADFGAKKHGVTMERTDLTETQWLQHAYEEVLDLVVYLKKILTEREKKMKKKITKPHPHALLMTLYAEDAKETEEPWERWEYNHRVPNGNNWESCTSPIRWDIKEYRRKNLPLPVGKLNESS